MLKKSYLCKAISVAKFCGIKESALLLVKSPNLYKEYTRHGAAHIRGLPIRVVYSGVWRYLQENTDRQPTFFNNKHCKISELAVCGEIL